MRNGPLSLYKYCHLCHSSLPVQGRAHRGRPDSWLAEPPRTHSHWNTKCLAFRLYIWTGGSGQDRFWQEKGKQILQSLNAEVLTTSVRVWAIVIPQPWTWRLSVWCRKTQRKPWNVNFHMSFCQLKTKKGPSTGTIMYCFRGCGVRLYHPASQTVVHGPAASTSAGSLLEVTESQPHWIRIHVKKFSRWYVCMYANVWEARLDFWLGLRYIPAVWTWVSYLITLYVLQLLHL